MTTFFLVHLLFNLNLILDIINSASTLLLLREKTIYQIRQLNFKASTKLSIHLIEYSAEFFTVFERVYLNPA